MEQFTRYLTPNYDGNISGSCSLCMFVVCVYAPAGEENSGSLTF